jgi:amino acid transporter
MAIGEATVVREVTVSKVYVRQSSGLVRNVGPVPALLSNLVGMGIVVNIFWVVYASALYPQANLADTVFFAVILNALVAYVYWMLATAMPRTGGDYVFVGRIFHPAAGFAVNAIFTVIMVTWVGLFPWLVANQGFQMMFANLYVVTGNGGFKDIALALGTNQALQFGIGAILVTLVILTMLLSTRNIFRLVLALFLFQAIVYVVFIALLATSSHDAFVARFNALNAPSGPTVADVVNQGEQNVGGPITFAGSLTLVGLTGVVYTMLSFIGYANSAYFAGELKGDPKRSQGLAIFVSPIVFAVLIYVLYASIYNVFSHEFLVGSSTWALFNAQSYPLLSLPSPAHLVVFVTDNPYIAALIPLGLVTTFMGFAIVYFFVPTRNLFAWAFDRVVPTSLATVSRRGVPYAAVLVYGAIAYISLYLTVYTTVFSYLTYSNFGWWIAVAIVCLAGAAFPFARRNLYNSAPRIVRASLGPIPILTILGALGFVLSLFVSWASIAPNLVGSQFGTSVNPWWVATIFVIVAVALAIYAISYSYNRAKGVPMELAFKELPPE